MDHKLKHPAFVGGSKAAPGIDVFDAHVQVGTTDPAGWLASAQKVLAALARVNGRAPLHRRDSPRR